MGKKHRNFDGLAGRRFGKWTVIREAGKLRKYTAYLCHCDCGTERRVEAYRLVDGKSKSCGCSRKGPQQKLRGPRPRFRGKNHHSWKGGRHQYNGYVYVNTQMPWDDKPRNYGEHQLVMMKQLGRPLQPGEQIHHKNGIRNDNRLENLELWTTNQPTGSRVSDLIEHAVEVLKQYAPERLAQEF